MIMLANYWSGRPRRQWEAGQIRRLVVSRLVMERLAVLAWSVRPRRAGCPFKGCEATWKPDA